MHVSHLCLYPQRPAEFVGTSPGESRTHVTNVEGWAVGCPGSHGQLSLGVGVSGLQALFLSHLSTSVPKPVL